MASHDCLSFAALDHSQIYLNGNRTLELFQLVYGTFDGGTNRAVEIQNLILFKVLQYSHSFKVLQYRKKYDFFFNY